MSIDNVHQYIYDVHNHYNIISLKNVNIILCAVTPVSMYRLKATHSCHLDKNNIIITSNINNDCIWTMQTYSII